MQNVSLNLDVGNNKKIDLVPEEWYTGTNGVLVQNMCNRT